MLTSRELKRLYDQDGPLQGQVVFETAWREERGLADSFVAFCEAERPREHLSWKRARSARQLEEYWLPMVAELEDGLRDGELLDQFLDGLPAEEGERAAQLLKEALGTTKVAIKRKKRTGLDAAGRARVRAVHAALDALLEAWAQKQPYSRDDLQALRGALAALDPPPMKPRDLADYVADADACLATDPLDAKKVYALIWMLRGAVPYHAPVLKAFRQWLEDEKEPSRCAGTRTEWLERLLGLDRPDRLTAARLLERAVPSPEQAEELGPLLTELRAD